MPEPAVNQVKCREVPCTYPGTPGHKGCRCTEFPSLIHVVMLFSDGGSCHGNPNLNRNVHHDRHGHQVKYYSTMSATRLDWQNFCFSRCVPKFTPSRTESQRVDHMHGFAYYKPNSLQNNLTVTIDCFKRRQRNEELRGDLLPYNFAFLRQNRR